MKQVMAVCLGVLFVAAASGAAEAATISYLGLDTTTQLNWAGTYGAGGSILWDISSGRPNYDQQPTNSNPAFVESFQWQFAGGGSGSGGGGSNGGGGVGDASADIAYALVLNESKQMTFTTFFYDANYGTRNSLADTDVALQVRLIDPGADPAQAETWRDITVGDLVRGVYAKWDVVALAGESIQTEVRWATGDGVGAAGFFLDNVADAVVPEPASMTLVISGLIGMAALRRRRRRA